MKYYFIILLILFYIYSYNNYHIYPNTNIKIYNNILYKYNYNTKIEKNIPFIINYNNSNINNLLNTNILLQKYGNTKVNIIENINYISINNIPKIKNIILKKYINEYIYKNNNSYYLKSEDEYNLLQDLDIEKNLINEFKLFKSPNSIKESISFWYGATNTITPFHYDCDHANLLYIIEGSKRIYMVHPNYEKYMKGDTKIQYGASWSSRSIDNVIINLKNNNIQYEEIILRKGQLLNIPRYWWHCVINIEPTMAITYHYYTFSSFFIPYKTL